MSGTGVVTSAGADGTIRDVTPRRRSVVAVVAAGVALVAVAVSPTPHEQDTGAATWVAPTPGPWRPPVVLVDPEVGVDQDEAQAFAGRVAADPRGWRRHLDDYAVRIVRTGTNGTQPMPGLIGLVRGERLAVISEEGWTRVGPRWLAAGGTLDDQRTWILNHELGHLITRSGDHVECPGPGQPAPVMRGVAYDIAPCTLNVWPNP